jgi:hypothetical protein
MNYEFLKRLFQPRRNANDLRYVPMEHKALNDIAR